MVTGDLNDIMYSFEKEGGKPMPSHFMSSFKDALDDCNLSDLGYYGDKFTWHRGLIRERLDRAISNEGWNNMFPQARVEHLEFHKSDHRPILLHLAEEEAHVYIGPYVLCFEARWLKEVNFRNAIEEVWQGLDPNNLDMGLAKKLAQVHKALHHWDKTVLRNSSKKLKSVHREIEAVSRESFTPENVARQKLLAEELERLLENCFG